MPRLKWLMFHIPMSSPHRMRMFGLSVLAISISFASGDDFTTTSRLACPPLGQLDETQSHGTEGERDRVKWCLEPLFRYSGERCEASAQRRPPLIGDGPACCS